MQNIISIYINLIMAKSKLDEKREKRKKKEKKSPLSKAVELVVHTLKKALQIFIRHLMEKVTKKHKRYYPFWFK